jgi:hypothetical protein
MYAPCVLYRLIIQTNKRTKYIYKQYFIYRKHSSMFRCTRIIFSQSFPSTMLKLQKSLELKNSIKSLNYNVYLTVTVDDKIQSINRCELSTVIITVYGSCYLGGCIYSLDCLVGVFLPMLVFPVCRYDKKLIGSRHWTAWCIVLWRSSSHVNLREICGGSGGCRAGVYCDYFIWCVSCAVVVLTCFVICGCVMCGFCNVWVCLCVGFVMCGRVCVGVVMCGCVYVWGL